VLCDDLGREGDGVWREGGPRRRYMYAYSRFISLYNRNYYSILKQLYSNFKRGKGKNIFRELQLLKFDGRLLFWLACCFPSFVCLCLSCMQGKWEAKWRALSCSALLSTQSCFLIPLSLKTEIICSKSHNFFLDSLSLSAIFRHAYFSCVLGGCKKVCVPNAFVENIFNNKGNIFSYSVCDFHLRVWPLRRKWGWWLKTSECALLGWSSLTHWPHSGLSPGDFHPYSHLLHYSESPKHCFSLLQQLNPWKAINIFQIELFTCLSLDLPNLWHISVPYINHKNSKKKKKNLQRYADILSKPKHGRKIK